MSKLKGKLAKRIMAIVLSGAMVMSNMSVYAAELTPEKETEIVSEVEETADTGTTVGTDTKETTVDLDDENAETKVSAVESSESASKEEETNKVESDEAETTATNVEIETATDTKTEETTETETVKEADESSVSETATMDETETEETTTEEESSVDVKDEDVKDGGPYILTSGETQTYYTLTDGANDETGKSGKTIKLDADNLKTTGRLKLEKVGGDVTKNSIKFTVTEGYTAKLDVWAISASSSTNSKIALYSEGSLIGEAQTAYATGSEDAVKDGVEYGKDKNPITITLSSEGLQGGKTYYIAVPADETAAANVYYIKVVETRAASTQPPIDVKNPLGHILTSGETQTYYTLTDGANDEIGKSGKTIKLDADNLKTTGRLKLEKVGGDVTKNSIKFTVTEGYTAKLDVWAISASSSTNSKIALYSEDSLIGEAQTAYATGNEEAVKDGVEYGKDKNPITVTLSSEGLQGGKTYYIAVPADETAAANVYYVKVTETDPNASTVEKVLWDKVDAPVIERAVQDTAEDGKLKGTVTVTVIADIAAGRAEEVKVILCDKDGNELKDSEGKEIAVPTRNADDKKATVQFTDKHLTESGTYTFKAVLSRGEGDTAETKNTKVCK